MIKDLFRNAFKNRTVAFYVTLSAAIIAFVGALLYLITDGTDRTFSLGAFLFVLIGALSVGLTVFTDLQFAPVIPSVLYSAGIAMCLRVVLPSLSDVWNGVHFIGGNAVLGTIFAAIFLVADVCSIIACFMEQRKFESYTKAVQ